MVAGPSMVTRIPAHVQRIGQPCVVDMAILLIFSMKNSPCSSGGQAALKAERLDYMVS
jgi:hypothetical protein